MALPVGAVFAEPVKAAAPEPSAVNSVLIEAARRKPLSQRVQEIGFRFGLAIVFTLMVFTLVNDLI